jgi:methylated-DNA-protein-cysteine methyltransferase-like protein
MAKQDLTARPETTAAVPASDAAVAAIHATVAKIPPGRVSSYGEIATRAGLPGRARLVGKALGKTPDDVELPWFRVLRSDGRIAFPPQSRPYREQRARLLVEGVRVERGRVDLARYGWDRNLDFALWAPPDEAAAPRRLAARKAPKKSAGAKPAPAKAKPAAAKTRPSVVDAKSAARTAAAKPASTAAASSKAAASANRSSASRSRR